MWRVKTIQEKQKKAELAEILNQLKKLQEEAESLRRQLEENNSRYCDGLSSGMPASQMAWYDNFTCYTNELIEKICVRIKEVEQKKEVKQSELVFLVNEIKTLEKMQEEQYREYLRQVAKEEENVLGDLMSYASAAETTD